MSPEWAKYKRDERSRRKDSGLVKKEVWIPPQAWEALRDLADRETELFLRPAESISLGQPTAELAHSTAAALWTEVAIVAGMTKMTSPEARQAFLVEMLRAFIRTMPKDLNLNDEYVANEIRKENEGYGEADAL